MNSEKELDALTAVLDKLREQYIAYRDILAKQREAIITNNVAELTEILTKIESIGEHINRLEGRCAYNIEVLSMSAGLEVKTIRDIIKSFSEYGCCAKIESIALELKKTSLEAKRIAASNAELLEISRSIIKETMNTIMSQSVDPRDRAWRTYGNAGGYSRTVRKEPVHLVNQRG